MDRPYDSIPRQGAHRGKDIHEEPTTNVRAQEAVQPSAENSSGLIQCSYSPSKGHYRIRRWQDESDLTSEEGYEEISRVREGDSLAPVNEALPEEAYIVFENRASGEVFFDRESELSNNWTGNGRFDQVTVFDDEEAASVYVDARQDASS